MPILSSRWLVSLAVCLALVAVAAPASAAPRRSPNALEDAVLDGDLDAEDVLGGATAGRPLARRAPGGSAWLSLAGFADHSFNGEREVGGFIVLGVPLGRLAQPPTGAAPIVRASAIAATSPVHDTGETVAPITPRMARSCVAAAWRAASVGGDDAHIDSVLSRARWSALLPEARFRALRSDDARLSTDTTTDASRLRDSAGANVALEARLTWRLDRLLYADDEPTFERMKFERHDARAKIAGRVLDALFHWQRAWVELRLGTKTSREESDPALRLVEAEATLDVLTSGWFSAWRSQRLVIASPPPRRPMDEPGSL